MTWDRWGDVPARARPSEGIAAPGSPKVDAGTGFAAQLGAVPTAPGSLSQCPAPRDALWDAVTFSSWTWGFSAHFQPLCDCRSTAPLLLPLPPLQKGFIFFFFWLSDIFLPSQEEIQIRERYFTQETRQ